MSIADEAQKIIDWMESDEEEAHAKFRATRRVNPEAFVRSLITFVNGLGRTDPALARRFIDRYYLTPAEKGFAEQEVFYTQALTAEQLGEMAAVRNIDIERSEIPRFRIDAKAQIVSGARQLKIEYPKKKAAELKRDVKRWTDPIFNKPPKPYTPQQVAEGVNFYLDTTKKNREEKDRIGKRSGGVLVTPKQWGDFLKKMFGAAKPPFESRYRAEVRKGAKAEQQLIKGGRIK